MRNIPQRTIQQRTIQHWISGSETTGASTRYGPVWNPATGAQQAQVALAEPADVDAAVAAAAKAWQEWRDVSLIRRARVMFALRDLMERHLDELAGIVADEHGKVVSDAKGEVIRGLEVVEYACGIPTLLKGEYSEQVSTDVDAYSFRQPLGVCAGITPFNFPVMVPMWMHPIAIAAGNTFILKPSERDPSASNFIARLYAEAGLPEGVFNVVHGDKVAVDAILDHPGIAATSFVGSTPDRQVRAPAGLRKRQAGAGPRRREEPCRRAARRGHGVRRQPHHGGGLRLGRPAVHGHLRGGRRGRRGRRPGREAEGQGRGHQGRPGPGRGLGHGPGRHAAGQGPHHRLRRTAVEQAGATLVVDGRGLTVEGTPGRLLRRAVPVRPGHHRHGHLHRRDLRPGAGRPAGRDLRQAIDIVNANPYGNGTAIFTSSGQAAKKFQRNVQVGMIGINVPIPVPMAFYSFGGWKDSLFGDTHVHGPEGVRFYTRAKAITSRWPDNEYQEHHRTHMHFPTAS